MFCSSAKSCARSAPSFAAAMPAIRGSESRSKTRRRRRDIDQVHADVHDQKHLARFKESHATEDLPGLGEFYCVECAKWFETENALTSHCKGKPHKKRLRLLKEEPYTQKEAEAAAGLSTDNGHRENEQEPTKEVQMSNADPSSAFA